MILGHFLSKKANFDPFQLFSADFGHLRVILAKPPCRRRFSRCSRDGGSEEIPKIERPKESLVFRNRGLFPSCRVSCARVGRG